MTNPIKRKTYGTVGKSPDTDVIVSIVTVGKDRFLEIRDRHTSDGSLGRGVVLPLTKQSIVGLLDALDALDAIPLS